MRGKTIRQREGIRIPRPPRNLDEAVKLSAWVSIQVARGNLKPAEAAVINKSLQMFGALIDKRDADRKLADAHKAIEELRTLKGTATT